MSPALSQSVVSPPSNHISWLFPECYGGFPSAHRRPNYHQFCRSAFCTQWQEKCFPCLSSPFLSSPFAISLSSSASLYLTLSPLLRRKACHSLIPSNTHPYTHTHTHIRVSEKRERGKLQDCVYFSRIIEICLDANGRSCPPKCLNISHTHTYTQRHANLHVNSSKRHLVARRLVYPSVYVCWGAYRQR